MNAPARRALSTIRRCLKADRVALTVHFRQRLAERGLLWADVLTVFDRPSEINADGFDDWGRERWIVSGAAATGEAILLVCAIERDEAGELTVFVTIYWKG